MKILLNTLFAFVIVATSFSSQASSVNLSISPSHSSINGIGVSFTVDILGAYSADTTEVLLGGASNLLFDESIIEVKSVTINAPTDIGSTKGTLDNSAGNGKVDTFGFASFSGVAGGNFNLATIEFESVGLGFSTLQLQDSQDLIFEWFDSNSNAVAFSSVDGSVNVVPVPAAAWMFISGLLALFQINRKKLN